MEETDATGNVTLDAEERELVRTLILSDPELVLADDQVMRALIRATGPMERKVVDLRDKLVERMETRLSKLVHTNRSVIAAAYENVASTRSVHRAVLGLIEAESLTDFATRLGRDVPHLVSIEAAVLCIEGDVEEIHPAQGLGEAGKSVIVLPRGMIDTYLAINAAPGAADIALREAPEEAEVVYGPVEIGSEALMRLTLPDGAGLLALGARDPERFTPEQGTDLLDFFGRVVGRLASAHLVAWHGGAG